MLKDALVLNHAVRIDFLRKHCPQMPWNNGGDYLDKNYVWRKLELYLLSNRGNSK